VVPSVLLHYGVITRVQLALYGNYWLCLNPLSPPSSKDDTATLRHDLNWVVRLLMNPRGIGEPWSVARARLPRSKRGDLFYVPSRRELLLSRCEVVILCWCMKYILTYLSEEYYGKATTIHNSFFLSHFALAD
jgi:hypothetical protein